MRWNPILDLLRLTRVEIRGFRSFFTRGRDLPLSLCMYTIKNDKMTIMIHKFTFYFIFITKINSLPHRVEIKNKKIRFLVSDFFVYQSCGAVNSINFRISVKKVRAEVRRQNIVCKLCFVTIYFVNVIYFVINVTMYKYLLITDNLVITCL